MMIAIVIKDLKIFIKDKRSLLLTFVIPIVLITLFAFAFGGVGKSNAKNKITLLVCNLDSTPLANKAVAQLDSLQAVRTVVLPLEEAEKRVKQGKESCVLIIHKGFSSSIASGEEMPLELKYDELKQVEVGLLQQSLIPTLSMFPYTLGSSKRAVGNRLSSMAGVTHQVNKYLIQERTDQLFDAISTGMIAKDTSDSVLSASPNFMAVDLKMTKLASASKDNQLSLIQAVAGTAVMMLLFSVVGIGMGIIDEKEEGTLRRLLYCPVNPLHIIWSKMIFANIISILQLVVAFLFAFVAFGLAIGNHLTGLFITIVATSFACSSFGVFLASLAKSRQQVQGLSTLIILTMSAIGGSMIPLFLMPSFMQKISVLSVNYWSIQAFYDVLWRGFSVTNPAFLSKIAVLLVIGTVLNVLAVLIFRKNVLRVV